MELGFEVSVIFSKSNNSLLKILRSAWFLLAEGDAGWAPVEVHVSANTRAQGEECGCWLGIDSLTHEKYYT